MMRRLPDFDCYAELNVARTATAEEVKNAYRALVREWHPDRNPSPEATKRMARINVAYEVIGNADNRSYYDRARGGSSTYSNPFGTGGNPFETPDWFSDLMRRAEAARAAEAARKAREAAEANRRQAEQAERARRAANEDPAEQRRRDENRAREEEYQRERASRSTYSNGNTTFRKRYNWSGVGNEWRVSANGNSYFVFDGKPCTVFPYKRGRNAGKWGYVRNDVFSDQAYSTEAEAKAAARAKYGG